MIKECLKLRTRALIKCEEIASVDVTCANVLKVVFDKLKAEENSESTIKTLDRAQLEEKIKFFGSIVEKMDVTIAQMNAERAKLNQPKIKQKSQTELMIIYVMNKIYRLIDKFKK